jgi:conjugative transposon TraK protein
MLFQQLKNIDSAFQHIKWFTMGLLLVCATLCCFTVYQSYRWVREGQERIYVLANGKALEAYAAERKDNVGVEARDHVKMFHHHFFTLDPDEQVIQTNLTRALYLADASAKRQYDNLKESSYYSNLISGNISQQVEVDSIRVDLDTYPYPFRCYARQRLIRPTTVVTRSLVTEGFLRNVSRSDHNPHGFLIERWQTLQNRDLKTEHRP